MIEFFPRIEKTTNTIDSTYNEIKLKTAIRQEEDGVWYDVLLVESLVYSVQGYSSSELSDEILYMYKRFYNNVWFTTVNGLREGILPCNKKKSKIQQTEVERLNYVFQDYDEDNGSKMKLNPKTNRYNVWNTKIDIFEPYYTETDAFDAMYNLR